MRLRSLKRQKRMWAKIGAGSERTEDLVCNEVKHESGVSGATW